MADYAALYPSLSFDLPAERVLRITLDAPGLNAVSPAAHGDLAEVWRTIDGPTLPILERMEATGIRIDVPALAALSKEMDAQLDQERRAIHTLAGGSFNVDSPKQLREVLFGALGLSPGRKTW